MLAVPLDRARQGAAFDIAACRNIVLGVQGVSDALHRLIDDRAFVQIAGDIMRGGADQLDAAIMGLRDGAQALGRKLRGPA